jgi:hypothetical protein
LKIDDIEAPQAVTCRWKHQLYKATDADRAAEPNILLAFTFCRPDLDRIS